MLQIVAGRFLILLSVEGSFASHSDWPTRLVTARSSAEERYSLTDGRLSSAVFVLNDTALSLIGQFAPSMKFFNWVICSANE